MISVKVVVIVVVVRVFWEAFLFWERGKSGLFSLNNECTICKVVITLSSLKKLMNF